MATPGELFSDEIPSCLDQEDAEKELPTVSGSPLVAETSLESLTNRVFTLAPQ